MTVATTETTMNFRKNEQSLMKPTSNVKSTAGQSGSNMALTAVAFQDHLMRNLSLADPLRKNRVHHAPPKKQLKGIKPVVDAGRKQGVIRGTKGDASSIPKSREVEYVLDQKPHPLTLAQKLGLMEAPEQPLTDLAWRDAKERSNRREDSTLPCVICKEEFGLQQQVLLSCSHVFHRNCLQAFERFTGKKTCPMCRKEQYQTRVIHEGAKLHRVRCATRIQACWRGYVVHSWYRKLRQTIPPKDLKLRKKFYEEKLQAITERLLRSYDTQVDAFLAEMDRSITASRDVFKNLEASNLRTITPNEWDRIQLTAVERGKTECPICIMPLQQPDNELDPIPHPPDDTCAREVRTSETWEHTPRTPGQNPTVKPPRCPRPPAAAASDHHLHRREVGERGCRAGRGQTQVAEGPPYDSDSDGSGQRRTVLLSCTHVFHLVCLEAFEELSLAQTKVCPVCRSGYQKKVMLSV